MEELLIIGTATLLFGAIVLIHELGHFVAAKLVGIKVITFSVGFGKRLWQRKIGETTFCIAAIPLGGFVLPASGPRQQVPDGHKTPKFMMSIGRFGEDEIRQIDESVFATSGTLAHASFWAKLFFYTNGLLFNLLLAFLVVFAFLQCGVSARMKNPNMQIATVFQHSTAAKAGLKAGDTIVEWNGKPQPNWDDVAATWRTQTLGDELRFKVFRNSEWLAISYPSYERINPRTKKAERSIGFSASMVPKTLPVTESITLTFQAMLATVTSVLQSIPGFSETERSSSPTESADGASFNLIGGLIEMGVAASASFEAFTAMFLVTSIVIVIFNALPLPACDGSQVLILVVETIRGSELPFVVKERISCCGLYLAFGLMAASLAGDAVEVLGRWVE